MSKKTGKRQNRKPDVTKETGYYKLKTQAVKDLVEADESNSPEVSEEELNKYRSGPKIKLADGVKILILKFWFAGAVCFFFIWGLSGYMADMLDTLFVTGIAMGIVTDILTNNAIRFFEATPGSNDRYIMVTLRGSLSFFLNQSPILSLPPSENPFATFVSKIKRKIFQKSVTRSFFKDVTSGL